MIGTGSSAIQSIPLIAEQAEQLTVFQRTPNFSIPARNGPISEERLAEYRKDPAAYREAARWSSAGVPRPIPLEGALMVSDEERTARYEAMWETSELLGVTGTFNDTLTLAESNDTLRDFIHGKIRSIVNDPEVAEALCPTNHYVGTKRACLDTELLRDLQPAPRPPRRPAQAAHRDDHRVGHRAGDGAVRIRCHRVRHRLRRHDRRDRRRRHHRPRRRDPARQVGRTDPRPTSVS